MRATRIAGASRGHPPPPGAGGGGAGPLLAGECHEEHFLLSLLNNNNIFLFLKFWKNFEENFGKYFFLLIFLRKTLENTFFQ